MGGTLVCRSELGRKKVGEQTIKILYRVPTEKNGEGRKKKRRRGTESHVELRHKGEGRRTKRLR